MTTRAKRSAKSSGIEALVDGDRDLLKQLMRESLQNILEAEMCELLEPVPVSGPKAGGGIAPGTTVGAW